MFETERYTNVKNKSAFKYKYLKFPDKSKMYNLQTIWIEKG